MGVSHLDSMARGVFAFWEQIWSAHHLDDVFAVDVANGGDLGEIKGESLTGEAREFASAIRTPGVCLHCASQDRNPNSCFRLIVGLKDHCGQGILQQN